MKRSSAVVLVLSLLILSGERPAPAQQAAGVPAFELDEATVASLQDGMASGRYTSRRLVDLYSERIKAIDRSGPSLHSVIEMNPEAAAIAEALDVERRAGRVGDRCTEFRCSSRTTSTRRIG